MFLLICVSCHTQKPHRSACLLMWAVTNDGDTFSISLQHLISYVLKSSTEQSNALFSRKFSKWDLEDYRTIRHLLEISRKIVARSPIIQNRDIPEIECKMCYAFNLSENWNSAVDMGLFNCLPHNNNLIHTGSPAPAEFRKCWFPLDEFFFSSQHRLVFGSEDYIIFWNLAFRTITGIICFLDSRPEFFYQGSSLFFILWRMNNLC